MAALGLSTKVKGVVASIWLSLIFLDNKTDGHEISSMTSPIDYDALALLVRISPFCNATRTSQWYLNVTNAQS